MLKSLLLTALLVGSWLLFVHAASVPAFGFDGAYARYSVTANVAEEISGNYTSYYENGSVLFSIQAVNTSSQSYNLTCEATGNVTSFSICAPEPVVGSFDSTPSLLPVVTQNNLSLLNQGKIPTGFLGYGEPGISPQVTSNVRYTDAYGSYKADLATLNETQSGTTLLLKVWVDSSNGVVVGLTENYSVVSSLGSANATLGILLMSTNIVAKQATPVYDYLIIAAVVVVAAIAAGLFAYKHRGSDQEQQGPPAPGAGEPQPASAGEPGGAPEASESPTEPKEDSGSGSAYTGKV